VKQGRRVWLGVIALIAVMGALACSFWADEAVKSWVADHPNQTAKIFMHYVSRIGDWQGHFALGLLLLGAAWWRGSKKWMRVFLAMLIACALAGIAARAIKVTTGRARPSVQTEHVWNGVQWKAKYHAFPSGHVASSTAFFAVLLFVNWRIAAACLPIPLLIASSRIYLNAHYLSDVVFAAMLGLLCAAVTAHYAFKRAPRPG